MGESAADDAYAADAAAAAARASALKKAADLVRGLISCAEVEAAINGTAHVPTPAHSSRQTCG